MGAIQENVDKYYVRRPMKDFEYLKSAVKPTYGQWVFGIIFGFLLSIGLSILFYRVDVFNEERE